MARLTRVSAHNVGWTVTRRVGIPALVALCGSLYADHSRGWWYVIWTRLHCTVGDLMILLSSFWITSIVFQTRFWIRKPKLVATSVFFVIGFVYTLFSEWHNTTVESWEYSPGMPVFLGIGLSPLLQWSVIPPILVFIVQRRLVRPFAPTTSLTGSH
jgi:hypothetical protein